MSGKGKKARRGFSLIELVIVVVIIGIIGAIAIPRMSRGAAGANDSSLKANLAVLRNAIDLYAAEHGGKFPALADLKKGSLIAGDTSGGNPLLDYTDANGACSATQTATHIYGPYLRSIPKVTVVAKASDADLFTAEDGDGAHWVYIEATGRVYANTEDAADVSSKRYADY